MTSRIDQLLTGSHAHHAPGGRGTRDTVFEVQRIPVASIVPDPENARKNFDADALAALADNIKRRGQIQNAVAYETDTPGVFQLIAGERRWRACQLAQMPTLMCMIVPRDMAQDVREEIAFAENMSREDLKPVEVARHWEKLMARWQCTTRELAARVGVAQSTVSKRLALLKLDADTQRAVDAGEVLKTTAVATTQKRRRSRGGRLPRGVHDFPAGVVKLRRGQTLEQLVAQIQSTLQPAAEPDTAVERATAA